MEKWLKTSAQLDADRELMISDYFDQNGQIFQPSYGVGYWLYGVEFDPERGWLGYEFDDSESPQTMNHDKVIKAWKKLGAAGLPKKYHPLHLGMMSMIFSNAVKKWGQNWYDDVDLPHMDEVVQYTLLGEVRYG